MPDLPHTRAPKHTLQSTAKETLMTPDNFTEAARAEAERRYNRIVRRNKTADEWLDEGRASGFTSGAEWAHDHLAAQEPTDDEVETAARAMRIETLAGTVRPGAAARWWDNGDVSPDEADKLRRLARAALSAARAARRDGEAR